VTDGSSSISPLGPAFSRLASGLAVVGEMRERQFERAGSHHSRLASGSRSSLPAQRPLPGGGRWSRWHCAETAEGLRAHRQLRAHWWFEVV